MFAPLFRATLFTVAVLLLTGSLDAQPPPADPDAKGTVTITKVTPSGTTLSVTGDRSAVGGGWKVGGVSVFAINNTTRRLYVGDVQLKAGKTTWEGAVDALPNATYRIYALHGLSYSDGTKTDSQTVASKFEEGVINVMGNPNLPKVGGSVTINTLTRKNGGVSFEADGTWTMNKGYRWPNVLNPLSVASFPVGGGVYRPGFPVSIGNKDGLGGPWGNCQFNVNSSLKYNVAAFLAIEPDPNAVPPNPDTPHHAVSEWKENQ
ncbi:MAG: hypothetical protein K2X87_29365 [Gemmataceae bacterium]|nr:hypothetical protein [Gemmataceae bacterium]